jgi:hypothetical protein
MGIQDAYNLGWKLALVLRGSSERLLDTYEEERLPLARSVLAGTDVGYKIVFSANPVITLLRERVLLPLLQVPRIQRAVLETSDQLDVTYRGSALAVDHQAPAAHEARNVSGRSPNDCHAAEGFGRATEPLTPPSSISPPVLRHGSSTSSVARTARCCCSPARHLPPVAASRSTHWCRACNSTPTSTSALWPPTCSTPSRSLLRAPCCSTAQEAPTVPTAQRLTLSTSSGRMATSDYAPGPDAAERVLAYLENVLPQGAVAVPSARGRSALDDRRGQAARGCRS